MDGEDQGQAPPLTGAPMPRLTATLDAWPLLPRPFASTAERPADEPAQAAFIAVAGLAAVFLLLRWALPGGDLIGPELARLVTLGGCLGGLALMTVLVALLSGVAVVAPMLPIPEPMKHVALAVFDHAVHLALVLTAAGVLGMIVLHGSIPGPATWFAAQALLLWGCHRTRLWLTGRPAA